MAKFDLNLQQINQLCNNITVISVNKGWFEVAESDKKIHGSKKLLEFNDSFQGQENIQEESVQEEVCETQKEVVQEEVCENVQEEVTITEENVQLEPPETPVKAGINEFFIIYGKVLGINQEMPPHGDDITNYL